MGRKVDEGRARIASQGEVGKRPADAYNGEMSIVCDINAHINVHAMDNGVISQGEMVDSCTVGRWGKGGVERENELMDSSVGGREFLMALPEGVFAEIGMRGFVGVENVSKGFGVRGDIGNMEIDSQGAGLIVRTIHDVVAR